MMSAGMIMELKPQVNTPGFAPSPAQDEPFRNIQCKALLTWTQGHAQWHQLKDKHAQCSICKGDIQV